MRVAFHTDQLWFPAPGGIGTYVSQLISAFERSKEPDLVTFQVAEKGLGTPEAPDVEVPGSIRSLYPQWAIAARPSLPEPLASCDVLHATNHAAVPPAAAGQALVVTVHDLAFDRFPAAFPVTWRWQYKAGVRAALRRATLLLVPSRATAKDLEARGADPARMRVTPLAAAAPGRGNPGVQERLGLDRPYVICPGTIEPRKNQVRVVRAFRQIAPDIPHALVLAGPRGWGSEELEAELARPGSERVIVTGRLSEPDLDALYRGADLVTYMSLYEGFGLPVLEAMARGIAVLASTTPAVAETAGDAAKLVDPQDVAGIAEAMGELLSDEAARAELGARGLKRSRSYSWKKTAQATLDAYREAVEMVRG